ncbi:MAG: histidine phosphatase family protein [Actinomycetia bacterium]|nr:histidine phosphatase family protein [Actinomycetes bacterium]MCP4222467.1 histidine phosphatase family protein [Actinomycetes bacterium]
MAEAKRPPSAIDQAFLTDDPDVGIILLVRHGQQQWPDPETSTTGDWIDPPLSDLGRQQADAVGKYLADEPVSTVYSSHLLRANHTGEAVASHHELDVNVVEDLEEFRMFGHLPPDQRAADTISEQALEGIRGRFVQSLSWDAYPHSEPSLDFRRRIGYSMEGIMAHHPGETVVVACHGGVINVVMAQILGLDIDFMFRPAHASVHRVRFGNGRRVIESLNEHQFLRLAGLLTY